MTTNESGEKNAAPEIKKKFVSSSEILKFVHNDPVSRWA